MQYIALLWTEKEGKLVQSFGPYPSMAAAKDAADKIAEWPAIKDGLWEVVPLYPNPKQPVHQPTQIGGPAGTITLHGQLYPAWNQQFTYNSLVTRWWFTPAVPQGTATFSSPQGTWTIRGELSH